MSPGSYDDLYWLQEWVHNDYCMTDLANNQKYTTAMFQICRSNSRWNPATVDVSKITRLEVLDYGKYVVGFVVLKEPSSAVSISTILQTAVTNLKRCSEWNLEVESQSGITRKWTLSQTCAPLQTRILCQYLGSLDDGQLQDYKFCSQEKINSGRSD